MKWLRRTLMTMMGLLMFASCHPQDKGSPTSANSSPVSVVLSTNVIRIGDVFQMRLSAEHPKTDTLTVPDLTRDKEIIVRNHEVVKHSLSENRVRTTLSYDLTSWVVGDHTLSTGTVQFVHGDGTTTTAPFPLAQITVRSTLTGENTPLRDIKGLVHWPAAFPRWLSGLLLVAALAAIAALAVRSFLTKPRVIQQNPPPLEPHKVALNALRGLLAKGWIESENIKPFYIELSSIVRRYVEDRFGLRAPERTTEEFIRDAVTSRLLSSDHQVLTSEFLEQCDLVKFARHRPARNDMQNAYNAAERLVIETVPPSPSMKNQQPSSISPSP